MISCRIGKMTRKYKRYKKLALEDRSIDDIVRASRMLKAKYRID